MHPKKIRLIHQHILFSPAKLIIFVFSVLFIFVHRTPNGLTKREWRWTHLRWRQHAPIVYVVHIAEKVLRTFKRIMSASPFFWANEIWIMRFTYHRGTKCNKIYWIQQKQQQQPAKAKDEQRKKERNLHCSFSISVDDDDDDDDAEKLIWLFFCPT